MVKLAPLAAALACASILSGASLAPVCAETPQAESTEPEAQEVPAWNLQVDPLTTVLGIAHVLLERRLTKNIAVYAGPSLKLYDNLLADDPSYRAIGVEFGARWFFSDTAPKGWWAGGRATIANVSANDESQVGGYVSALAGYAWIFDNNLVLSAALGVSYFEYHAGDADEGGVEGVLPGAHTAIGYAF